MLGQLVTIIKENRSWIILSVLFFAGGSLLTYYALSAEPEILAMMEETYLPMLGELGEDIFGGNLLRGVVVLFIHNLMAVFQILFLSLLLGIPAMFSSIANGALLGTVAYQLAQTEIAVAPFLLVSILPHGIFELPVLFLGAGLGLKLGYHIVFPMPAHSRKDSLISVINDIKLALPGMVVLLATAAVVEVFITPSLMKLYLNI